MIRIPFTIIRTKELEELREENNRLILSLATLSREHVKHIMLLKKVKKQIKKTK